MLKRTSHNWRYGEKMVPDAVDEVAGECVGRGEEVVEMYEDLHTYRRDISKSLFTLDGASG
jgi:hypothetical protein